MVSLYGGPDGSAFAKPGAASAAPQVIAFLPLWSLCSSLLPLLQAAGAIQPALEVHRDDEA